MLDLPDVSLAPVAATELRSAFGRFPTGVTVVTCLDAQGHRVGLTANSLTSLSLEPPLLAWALRRASPSLGAFQRARYFAVNVLHQSQVELSRRFSRPVAAKFDEGSWHEGLHGVPLLDGAAAVFECEQFGVHETGDHLLFIGRILRIDAGAQDALVFHAGRYHTVGPAP